jgi:hypothetical protein|tara:strand:+ start:235 stop:684 length:450 start_codon:yes stop_codon:yes gene_type:complete
MATSRRRDIANFLVGELKKIDGGVSTFDSSYTYQVNLFNNVFRRLKFLDEINDFPSVYLQAGTENRIYDSKGLTTSTLDIMLRVYIHTETAVEELESTMQDIEFVIYNMDTEKYGMMDVQVSTMSTDEGLLDPYGIGEVGVTVQYDVTD